MNNISIFKLFGNETFGVVSSYTRKAISEMKGIRRPEYHRKNH